MFARSILLTLAALVLLAAPARAEDKDWADCTQGDDRDRLISGCTKFLARGASESRDSRATAYYNLGVAYEGKSDYDRAIRNYDEAIRLDPKIADAYNARGYAYVGKGDYDHAIRDYDEAIRLDPKNAFTYSRRGNAYTSTHDYDHAIRDYNEAVRLKPEYHQPDGLSRSVQYPYVDQNLGRLELVPGEVFAYLNRGLIYFAKGDQDRAIADFDQAIQLGRDYLEAVQSTPRHAPIALFYRGDAYSAKGDLDRAIADYNEVMRSNPEDAWAYLKRGVAYFGKGDYDHSIADFDAAIRFDPKIALAHANRAEIRARKGNFEGALADSETAIRLDSKIPESYAYRAYIFGRRGQLDRAFTEIDEAFKLNPQNSDVLLYRGELHLMKGDARAALADFEASLARSPRNHFAQAGRDTARTALAVPQPSIGVARLSESRVALVIGNAHYAAQSPLKNPSNDARAIAAGLRGAGFKKVVSAADLTRDALVKALQEFQDEADRADWAVIYFSGHGVEIGGVNYVVPTDARLLTDRNAPDEAVSLDRLMTSVGGAHKLRIVILDACRDNPFVASMQRTIASRSAGKGLAPVEPTRATLVVYAARDGQLAQDGAGDNSPFAAALAKRLGEPHVEVSKLFRLVTDDVLDATGRRQQPFVYGSLPGREDFYFRP